VTTGRYTIQPNAQSHHVETGLWKTLNAAGVERMTKERCACMKCNKIGCSI